MVKALNRFFESPDDKDPGFIILARNILIFTIIATLVSIIVVATTSNTPGLIVTIITLAVSTIIEIIALRAVLRGNLSLAKMVVPAALICAITIIALSANSIHDISIIGYPLILVIAMLLQGRQSLYVTTPFTLGAFALLGILDMAGISRSPVAFRTGFDDIMIGMLLLLATAGILNLSIGRLKYALSQAEAANLEAKKLKDSLEQQVEARTVELTDREMELVSANEKARRHTAQLEALAQVTRTITSLRELKELLPSITAVISEKFEYYHVGVFMNDPNNIYTILSATNSEGGRKMLARGHQLRIGEQGIVGYVTATGQPRVALDVGEDAVYFNNPDMPATRSEMALPLIVGGSVIGALDVQSSERNAFTAEDIGVLTTLADQVSLAIQNARLFEQTQKSLHEAETMYRQFLRETWAQLPQEQKLTGFRYSVSGVEAIEESSNQAQLDHGTKSNGGGLRKEVSVPVVLRGEKIGLLSVHLPERGQVRTDQLDLIKAVAERVALSIENARLFEETTRRAERERLVSDITTKIRSTNDPEEMIRTAIEELQEALGATRVEIIPQRSSTRSDQ